MNTLPSFDEAQAHRFFSAECFNRAWTLIEKPSRSPEEDEQMLLLSQASLWHWSQRADCTPRNLSISYWQLSRVYALLRRLDEALRCGGVCLSHRQNEAPFYLGYAHEVLPRAAMLSGDGQRMNRHLNEARRLADQVTDADERDMLAKDRDMLAKDLETIR